MKRKDILLIGLGAVVGYFLYKQMKPSVLAPSPANPKGTLEPGPIKQIDPLNAPLGFIPSGCAVKGIKVATI